MVKGELPPGIISEVPDQPHLIGYARVSRAEQNPQLQIDALIRAGVDERDIYVEQVSGASKKRPQFEAMLKDVRKGDVVVVWKLDRLGRTNIGLHQTYEFIRSKGANLRILDNTGLDTTTAAGRLLFGVLAIMAQFERDVGVERTREGLAAAARRGRKGGARPKNDAATYLKVNAEMGPDKGAKHLKMSKSGFIKAVQRARREKEMQTDDE